MSTIHLRPESSQVSHRKTIDNKIAYICLLCDFRAATIIWATSTGIHELGGVHPHIARLFPERCIHATRVHRYHIHFCGFSLKAQRFCVPACAPFCAAIYRLICPADMTFTIVPPVSFMVRKEASEKRIVPIR